jgi:acyl-coenzyme A thioesterase PaaI-like protein
MTPARLRRFMNLWPPFLFSGVRVQEISGDWRRARVALRLRWYNRNYVGTHFGGSLFAMTDPFWMILTLQRLGRDYIVWDKAGEIEFVAPGRADVFADFHVDDQMLEEIRAATANGEKYLRWCETPVVTANGEVIARVRKQIYVRRKRERSASDQRDAGQGGIVSGRVPGGC